MAWLYLIIVIIASTALWMISRWAMQGDGDSKVQGLWISIVGLMISCLILLLRDQSIYQTQIIISGLIVSFASAIGFLVIMMYCLKIGPAGLTLTINNSMMVFGILYGIIFLDPHIPGILVIVGIIFAFSGLILIGMSGSNNNAEHHHFSTRWLKLVMIGAAFAGISFCVQAYMGLVHPGIDPLIIFIFWINLFSIPILLSMIFYTKSSILKKREMIGGFSIGILTNLALFFTLYSMQNFGAAIVFPICVASPMVIMLVISHFIYKEKLGVLPLIGAVLAVLSVILLSLKN
jgi:drug/metabolite transporter (DMT)-like permease